MSNFEIRAVGNLGRDPEVMESKSGTEYVRASVAVTTGWGDNKKTEWVNLTAFDPKAIRLLKAAKKGSLVNVTGDFQPRVYEKDGPRMSLDAIVTSIDFINSGSRDSDSSTRDGGRAASTGLNNFASNDEGDDSIPF